jgi:zinc transport system ATP-binding protein
MKDAIFAKDLTFSYEDTKILNNVSFQIQQGEFIGIFGPNGGGKTTLLKLILGFLHPSHGELFVFGQPPEKARNLMAYVPQKLKFDPQFPISVIEIVQMGLLKELNFWGRFTKQTKEKALNALKEVGLEDKAYRSFGTLSGGEAQRVLIARALVSNPKLLLLDEPTASVDASGEKEIYKILHKLKHKMTILMVTHHLSGAIEQVERVLCVQRGILWLSKEEVCGHFAIGLYHPPIKQENNDIF